MIPRYATEPFIDLWSDQTRYETWLQVELAACEAMEQEGLVPQGTAEAVRSKDPKLDPAAIERIEQTTRHDVIAFLTHVEQQVGAPARWLHRGMTSSDVLDTSFAILLTRATDMIVRRLDGLLEALRSRIEEHRHTVMIGRSHGIHAEPVTFGLVLAGHFAEMKRARERLVHARQAVAVGKIAGAVGTYAHLSPTVERTALQRLGLRPETVATQVVARDRHAELLAAMALLASGIERLATNIRHWQRTEVGEAQEPFGKGQKGSSAMPHKRNPVLSENLCGLARVVRSSIIPGLENIALWHERDISHSSVERMIFPDATTTLDFMLGRATKIIQGLVIYEERARANLEASGGLFFSESVLLALVDRGLPRQEAYVLVQRNAMKAIDGHGTFHDNLANDQDVTRVLDRQTLDRCFDLDHALRHVDEIIDRALEK